MALALGSGAAPRAPAAVESGHRPDVEMVELDWVDTRRRRHVPVRLYLPVSRDPTPLVVFSHGMGGSRRSHHWLGHHLACHGIASLNLQHVGSDNALWSGSIWGVVGRLQGAANEGEAVARVHDLRFAIDTLLSSDFKARIDPERIIAGGHSYGANTTLLASGAHIEREGRAVELRDPRVRAAIVISAPPFYGEAQPRRVLQAVTVPSLHVTCTDDVIRIPGYYSGAQDRVAVYDSTGSTRKWLAVYQGGSHSAFTDWGGSEGANQRLKYATRNLAVAFVATVVGGDTLAMADWQERHAPMLAQFSAVGA